MQIGRFKIRRKLGAGNQGVVYLCDDLELQRQVAVKLLRKTLLGGARGEEQLRREAQTMSRIQHPNIVSVYELGRHEGQLFMVCEYVEGRSLSEILTQHDISVQRSLDITEGLLEGLCQAHGQGIVHRDLKPANIMIAEAGTAKIMDFGIASTISRPSANDDELVGTPRYMAPEYIEQGMLGTQTDVFALGLILYEMLTGSPAFDGGSPQELLDKILSQVVRPPSASNPEVDQRLDALVLKAVAEDSRKRFASAVDMLSALQAYRKYDKDRSSGDAGAGGTVEFLLRRMRLKSDFPALSQSISALNKIIASDEKHATTLAGVILKDYALTSKILKVVNSAYYNRFAGNISTVSRAIVVLGMEPIRAIAASLIFFEHLRDKSQAERLKNHVSAALFSAGMGRTLAVETGAGQAEECFLCAMVHDLGRILTTYYLPEEGAEVERLCFRENMDEEQAQKAILGMTYEDIGIAIARQWNFPFQITGSMCRIKPGPVRGALMEEDSKRVIANFANETTRVLASDDPGLVIGLIERYRGSLNLDRKKFERLVSAARQEFRKFGKDFCGQDLGGHMSRILEGSHGETARTEDNHNPGSDPEQPVQPGLAGNQFAPAGQNAEAGPGDSETILAEGIEELTNLLMEEHTLTQLINIVLETMYRGMAFGRVLLCLRDVNAGEMRAKLGFGTDIESFLPNFRFPAGYERNVFHAALKNRVDVYIADTTDAKIKANIPGWYRKISTAGAFLLFPLVVKGRPLGLIYADHPKIGGVDISPRQLKLLKALRNQVVLSFRDKR